MLGFKVLTDILEEVRESNKRLHTLEKITVQQYKALEQIKFCLKDHQKALEILLKEEMMKNDTLHKELKTHFTQLTALLDTDTYEARPSVKVTFGKEEESEDEDLKVN